MALDRTNMVSLLDVGSLMGGTTTNILELGTGYVELEEDWGPDIESSQYVNMAIKMSTMKGYEFSVDADREYINDEVQKYINDMFKQFPTGDNCKTYYYRFFKTDISGSTGECVRIPVIVAPSTAGGAGGDILKSAIQIRGNGKPEVGTVTIGDDGTYSYASPA